MFFIARAVFFIHGPPVFRILGSDLRRIYSTYDRDFEAGVEPELRLTTFVRTLQVRILCAPHVSCARTCARSFRARKAVSPVALPLRPVDRFG